MAKKKPAPRPGLQLTIRLKPDDERDFRDIARVEGFDSIQSWLLTQARNRVQELLLAAAEGRAVAIHGPDGKVARVYLMDEMKLSRVELKDGKTVEVPLSREATDQTLNELADRQKASIKARQDSGELTITIRNETDDAS